MGSQERFLTGLGLDPRIVYADGAIQHGGTVLRDTFTAESEKKKTLLEKVRHTVGLVRTVLSAVPLVGLPCTFRADDTSLPLVPAAPRFTVRSALLASSTTMQPNR